MNELFLDNHTTVTNQLFSYYAKKLEESNMFNIVKIKLHAEKS